MSYEKVKQARQAGQEITIGTKQTTKAIETGKALEVFIAKDADPRITAKIIALCKKSGVTVLHVESMRQLGRACSIEVGAAMAAVLKDS
jgi:large subunit ribosomal protein L7A